MQFICGDHSNLLCLFHSEKTEKALFNVFSHTDVKMYFHSSLSFFMRCLASTNNTVVAAILASSGSVISVRVHTIALIIDIDNIW